QASRRGLRCSLRGKCRPRAAAGPGRERRARRDEGCRGRLGASPRDPRFGRTREGFQWPRARRRRQATRSSAVAAGLIALLAPILGFAAGVLAALGLFPVLIRRLRELRAGQVIQQELPESHQRKAGTPTAGGLLLVVIGAAGALLAVVIG